MDENTVTASALVALKGHTQAVGQPRGRNMACVGSVCRQAQQHTRVPSCRCQPWPSPATRTLHGGGEASLHPQTPIVPLPWAFPEMHFSL